MNFKKDFPIFLKNPNLIYLDNAATTQKPKLVINWIKDYFENSYSNIHRWMYDISIKSEEIYDKSKQAVLKHTWATNSSVVYTYNASYAFNLLIKSLIKSKKLQKWDKVLLWISEHNSNVVPWLIAKEEIWIEIDFIKLDDKFDYDIWDFYKKYDKTVKVISLNYVSNITWVIYNLSKIQHYLRSDTIFIVDWSQAVPNLFVDFDNLKADFLIFTWHKVMADTWIWVLVWTDFMFEQLKSSFGWWWSIELVWKDFFSSAPYPQSREAWTPHLVWALSLLKSFEYIDKIWWYETLWKHEQKLAEYILNKFDKIKQYVEIIWPKTLHNKVALFSFVTKKDFSWVIGQKLSEKNVCIRTWWHCAHLLIEDFWIRGGVSRMSAYIYNTTEDIDTFFKELEKIVK